MSHFLNLSIATFSGADARDSTPSAGMMYSTVRADNAISYDQADVDAVFTFKFETINELSVGRQWWILEQVIQMPLLSLAPRASSVLHSWGM